MDETIWMKLYLYDRRMCKKGDNLGANYFKEDIGNIRSLSLYTSVY